MNETAPVQKQDIDSLKSKLNRIVELLEKIVEAIESVQKTEG